MNDKLFLQINFIIIYKYLYSIFSLRSHITKRFNSKSNFVVVYWMFSIDCWCSIAYVSIVTKTRTSPGHLLAIIIIQVNVYTSVWVQRRIFHFCSHVRRDHLTKSLIIIRIPGWKNLYHKNIFQFLRTTKPNHSSNNHNVRVHQEKQERWKRILKFFFAKKNMLRVF